MHFQQHHEHLRLGQTRPILCVLYLQYGHYELLIALSTEMPVTCSSVNPGFNDTTQQALKLIVLGSSPCLGWLIPRIQAIKDHKLVLDTKMTNICSLTYWFNEILLSHIYRPSSECNEVFSFSVRDTIILISVVIYYYSFQYNMRSRCHFCYY